MDYADIMTWLLFGATMTSVIIVDWIMRKTAIKKKVDKVMLQDSKNLSEIQEI